MSWTMRARCQAIVSASAGLARRIRNKSDIWTTKTDFSFVTTAKRRSLQTSRYGSFRQAPETDRLEPGLPRVRHKRADRFLREASLNLANDVRKLAKALDAVGSGTVAAHG